MLAMGTAPPDPGSPAMPDPHRVVSRSVLLLKRLGMTDQQALEVVIDVAWSAGRRMIVNGYADPEWLLQVFGVALTRLEAPKPSDTDYKGHEHGDGTRGGAGRAETGTETAEQQ